MRNTRFKIFLPQWATLIATIGFATAVIAQLPAPTTEAELTSAEASSTFIPRTAAFIASAQQRVHPMSVPRVSGRLSASQLGLIINTEDPYSVEVGEFYIKARRLKPEQVLRIQLPIKSSLTPDEFRELNALVTTHFGADIQALALAWRWPFAVNCNSITSALTLGFDAELCKQTCNPPRRKSVYFNTASIQPWSDLKIRPSMMLAAQDPAIAKQMIQRGVASDATLGKLGGKSVNAYFVKTQDPLRSARAPFFPPAGVAQKLALNIRVVEAETLSWPENVVLYMTGTARVEKLDQVQWVPGALADHMTSSGGQLDGRSGQTMAIEWLTSGATASYGTVSEPCSHPQKFPHPQVLLMHYIQGATALEAYWKSVAWPQQGVFVGEPLAAPFAPITP